MALAALIPAATGIISELLGLIPDPKARQEKEKLLMEFLSEASAQQTKINELEAQHPSLFVSGWRPFVGWSCGIAFAYHFIMQPILVFALIQAGLPSEVPVLDISALTTVLMGMLGLGGLRTYEKLKGVARK